MTEAPRAPGAERPYGVRAPQAQRGHPPRQRGPRGVDAWRAQGYPGARRPRGGCSRSGSRKTTGADRRALPLLFCQREAVETFIYLPRSSASAAFADLIEYAQARRS